MAPQKRQQKKRCHDESDTQKKEGKNQIHISWRKCTVFSASFQFMVHFVNLCVWVRERKRDGWSMEVGKYYQIVMVNLLYGILNNILPSEWHMICIKFE